MSLSTLSKPVLGDASSLFDVETVFEGVNNGLFKVSYMVYIKVFNAVAASSTPVHLFVK